MPKLRLQHQMMRSLKMAFLVTAQLILFVLPVSATISAESASQKNAPSLSALKSSSTDSSDSSKLPENPSQTSLSTSHASATQSSTDSIDSNSVPETTRNLLPFQPSESLAFEASYLGLPVGTLSLTIGQETKSEGVTVWPIIGTARTAPAFVFFPVRDRYISLFNPTTKLTESNELLANENRVVRRERVKFDRQTNKATVRKAGGGKSNSEKVMDIPNESQDLLAMLYFLRTMPLKDGDTYEGPIFTGNRTFLMKAEVIGNETLRLSCGTFDTKRVHVQVAFSGKLESRREVRIFFTDDAHHMPVRVDAEFFIGTLAADLTSYTLGDR